MKKGLFSIALLLAAFLAACGNAAPTGSTSATSTGSISATSDTGTGSTSATSTTATDTSMMGTSTAATSTGMMGTSTTATDTSMMGTSTAATSTGMMGTSTTATDTSMMGTSTAATSTSMMTGTMESGTAMPMTTSTSMMTGTMESGTAMPMTTSTSMMTGTATTANGDALLAALSADPQFKQLVTALQLTGLDKQIASAGPVTIFAPTDTAFAALPQATLTALLADPTKLATILSYHVAQGRITATQVSSATSVPTLEGENITVSASGGTVTLNNAAKVTSTEIDTADGVVHVIDQVLIPPSVKL